MQQLLDLGEFDLGARDHNAHDLRDIDGGEHDVGVQEKRFNPLQ